MKDRQSEWRGDPRTHHRFRRSRSPVMNDRFKQRPRNYSHMLSARRSVSRMQRQDYPLRRSDDGKGLTYDCSPPPQHLSQHHYRSQSPILYFHNDGFRFQHNHKYSDRPSFNLIHKSSQSAKHADFRTQINEILPPSSIDIDQGMRIQKLSVIGEGPSRSLYLDNPRVPTALSLEMRRSGGSSLGIGTQENEIHSFNDKPRDSYDDMNRRRAHSRDLYLPKLPSSHLRPFSSTSSISILNEEHKGKHHNYATYGMAADIDGYSTNPMECYSYDQVAEPEPLRHGLLAEYQIHDYDRRHHRSIEDHRYSTQDEPYKGMPLVSSSEFRTSTSLTISDQEEQWMNSADSPNRNLIARAFSNRHHSLHRDGAYDYDEASFQQRQGLPLGNWHGRPRVKSSWDYESMPFEEGVASEKDFFSMSYREEHRNRSLLSEHDLDDHRRFMSAHGKSNMDNMSDYDAEIIGRRNYPINDTTYESDSPIMSMNNYHSFTQYESERLQSVEEPVGPLLSKSQLMEDLGYRKYLRGISTITFNPSGGATSMHIESHHSINLKGRLMHTRSNFQSSPYSERSQNLLRPCKYWRKGTQDKISAHDGGAHVVKNDPPEDSEEFKQLVHKAFLHYSKLLNESSRSQRLYQNQGNTYRLLCDVCGSTSKEFVGTNSLVTHSYHSLKTGLRTEHLGFHKAICVLLGWNWRVAPENSRAYQSMPVSDAKAMKEDLILWPPLVIIQNNLTGDGGSIKAGEVLTAESLEKMLRDMGFDTGKFRVCLGKPADRSIFVVKFLPTFSGFQEAERLHKHFSKRRHGKLEFRHGKGSEGASQLERADEMLFGYLAVAEDLIKLDPETRRRSRLKSKKDDIEAIADAPVIIS